MRYCYNCGRMTLGQPLFCNFCGRSYDIKLCPRLHVNPRGALICSQCGSRDLTFPQPKVRWYFRPLLILLTVLPGVLLLFGTVFYLFVFLYVAFTRPDLQLRFMLLGLPIALLWLVYLQLPSWSFKSIQKRLKR